MPLVQSEPNPSDTNGEPAQGRLVHDTYSTTEPGMEMRDLPQASQIDTSWLPFAAKTYHISPNLEDYVVKHMPICPADLPNRNGIGFPLEELTKYQPPPVARQVYRAWTGCPVHLEHDNEDHTKALGVIFDTSLRMVKTHGNGKHWMVHGLVGVDKNKYPEIAQKLLNNELNTGSMGAMADYFTCSVCGHRCGENQFMNCPHITSTQQVNWKLVDHMGEKKLAYLNAHNLSPIEYSVVADPAWASCLNDDVLTVAE
jgi:hypothetical protein